MIINVRPFIRSSKDQIGEVRNKKGMYWIAFGALVLLLVTLGISTEVHSALDIQIMNS